MKDGEPPGVQVSTVECKGVKEGGEGRTAFQCTYFTYVLGEHTRCQAIFSAVGSPQSTIYVTVVQVTVPLWDFSTTIRIWEGCVCVFKLNVLH